MDLFFVAQEICAGGCNRGTLNKQQGVHAWEHEIKLQMGLQKWNIF